MELTWLLLVATCLLVAVVFLLSDAKRHRAALPPGPASVPLIGNLPQLRVGGHEPGAHPASSCSSGSSSPPSSPRSCGASIRVVLAVGVRGRVPSTPCSRLFVANVFGEVLDELTVRGNHRRGADMMRVRHDRDRRLLLPPCCNDTPLSVAAGKLCKPSVRSSKLCTGHWLTQGDSGRTSSKALPATTTHRISRAVAAPRCAHCYVDSLLDMRLEEDGGRALTEDEIASLCSEFLGTGTDLPVTALEWIMAEIVKNRASRRSFIDEINKAPSGSGKFSEEDMVKMLYLKAVVLEGLRRHPPGHIMVPRAAAEDVELGAYVVPRAHR
ncbi:hypothetical protein HU200_012013 [Digitaria exilis]|uniref:Cytochrome P450 n=1 Tax=Digitaria exilis TaxID=1010633 RepID=A0A835FH45_9POAL|nr:hypothetical protein HU200_012013 [Digitaria exilis]